MRRFLIAGASLLLAGCLEKVASKGVACTDCHGTMASPAPPLALGDLSGTTETGVGAHQAHLGTTRLGRKVACTECHVVPTELDSAGHIDTQWPAEVVFGPLARTGTSTPSWDHGTLTCGVVYCHGATLGGGTHTAPVWTLVDSTQITCGSCHSTPPPPPHPVEQDCAQCHSPTAGPGMTIANAETHIDGTVQLEGPSPCSGCHGDETSLAPPPDSRGGRDPAQRSVGAHRAHTSGGKFSSAVACGDCHVVPAAVGDPGHLDSSPAEVRFAGRAVKNGQSPSYDASGSCSGTYCHASNRGGTVPAPSWIVADGTQAACGACHGLPPPSPHPQSSSCGGCHSPAGANLTIRDPSKHVDGNLDF